MVYVFTFWDGQSLPQRISKNREFSTACYWLHPNPNLYSPLSFKEQLNSQINPHQHHLLVECSFLFILQFLFLIDLKCGAVDVTSCPCYDQ